MTGSKTNLWTSLSLIYILWVRETKALFSSPIAWIVLAVVSIIQGASVVMILENLSDRAAGDTMVFHITQAPLYWFQLLIIPPLITMKAFAEEEQQGTLETLLTSRMQAIEITLAKYFSALTFFLLLISPNLIHLGLIDSILSEDARLPIGPWFSVQLITFAIGSLFIAFGCWGSSLVSNQLIAGVITAGIVCLFYAIGWVTKFWGSNFAAASLFEMISCREHLQDFSSGLVSSSTLFFYLSFSVFMLWWTSQSVTYRANKR